MKAGKTVLQSQLNRTRGRSGHSEKNRPENGGWQTSRKSKQVITWILEFLSVGQENRRISQINFKINIQLLEVK